MLTTPKGAPDTEGDASHHTRWTHRGWLVAGAAAVTAGLLGAIRIWLPSVMHVHGDAGSTPAVQLGLFALAWFLVPLLIAPTVRRVDARLLWRVAIGVAVLARLGLQFTDGGPPQLYLAGLCVVGGSVALVALAAGGPSGHLARVGVVLGLGIETVFHATLGTVDLVWREGVVTVLSVLVIAAGTVAIAERASRVPLWWPSPLDADGAVSAVWTRGAAWPWLAVGPAIALYGVLVSPPSRLELAVGIGIQGAVALLAVATAAAVVAAAVGPVLGAPVAGTLGAVLVVLAAVGAVRPIGVGSAVGQLALPVAIGFVLGAPGTTPGDSGPRRRGTAAAGSLLLFLVIGFGYYAAYELPLPVANQTFLVAAAIGLGSIGVAAARDGRAVRRVDHVPLRGLVGAAAGLVLLGVVGAVAVPTTTPTASATATSTDLRVAAYNIHMGYDVDGRFDVAGLGDAIRSTRADVVVLNEVDRGWLLEGGHDLLRLLRDETGMPATFAPAADDVWGNAILSRHPLRDVRTVALPSGGAAMRRSFVSAVVRTPGGDLAVVGTHLHHVEEDRTVRSIQARAVAAEVSRLRSRGLPVAVLGDLSAAADAPELEPLDFLDDAVPGGAPTYPSDDPRVRLDHVLVTPGVTASDAVIGDSTASDHLPVSVTLTLPGSEPG
ncbi:MAG: endonuclease/exonuclease/phosphatase family protein [Nitriliruptor sp.]